MLSCQKTQAMPLSSLETGEKGVIRAVKGNGDTVKHLHTLGFVEGASITMESMAGNGGLIVSVKDVRMALSREAAVHILVELAQ